MLIQLVFPEDPACAQQRAKKGLSQLRIVTDWAVKDKSKVVTSEYVQK